MIGDPLGFLKGCHTFSVKLILASIKEVFGFVFCRELTKLHLGVKRRRRRPPNSRNFAFRLGKFDSIFSY